MKNTIHDNGSLIALCKRNSNLRYVTIKQGKNDNEIYVFKYKKDVLDKEILTHFWYGFICPDETVIILGAGISRRMINYAYCMAFFEQEKIISWNSKGMFIMSMGDNPVMVCPIEKLIIK